MPQRTKKKEATDEQRARAADFGRWQQLARERKGWSMTELAANIPDSYSQVRLFDGESSYSGIDNLDRYREPPLSYIAAVARATGADYWAGVVASRGPNALLAETTKTRLEVMFTWNGRPATLNVPDGMPPDLVDRLRRLSETFLEGQDSPAEQGTQHDGANSVKVGPDTGEHKNVRRRGRN